MAMDNANAQARSRLILDFLVRQVQSACIWFKRLDKTQALL